MSSVPERDEIAEDYTWALDEVYPDAEAWEEAYADVQDRIEELGQYEGELENDATTLRDALETRETVFRKLATVRSYATLRSAEDTQNQEYQALKSKAEAISSAASSAVSFIKPELQAIPEDTLENYLQREPALQSYEHYFDDVRRTAEHTRSPEIESLLADLGEVASSSSDIYSMLSNADMTFPTVERPDGETVEITQGNFTTLQKHTNRDFRRQVHASFYDEWETVRNSVGTALQNSVRKDVKYARARNYETALEAALDGPNIPPTVYETLTDTVQTNIDVLHRHAELKRRALDVDSLKMWDLYVPITGDEGPTVEYEQAKQYIIDALAPLGEAYQSRVAEGLESRWVDVYENKGKRSGAFSAGTYDTQPYILMNYQDTISSMYTLAHELGHSMHSELAKEAQPWHYSDYTIFVAEVASTVNETLLTQYLLENVEDEAFRRHVLDEYLERVRSTLFRQTMFAEFEAKIHELAEADQPLTPDRFEEIYRGLKQTYYEPAALDDRIDREWMRIPHFYYNFYVYKYATGISAAMAVVERIQTEGLAAAESYREALAMGGSAYPIEILDHAGVDVTDSTYIETAMETQRANLDEMEALLD
jgi:oligopeptidase F. Metallo peptidase. MEROPS family M03B